MSKPVILINGGPAYDKTFEEDSWGINKTYVMAVGAAGGAPVLCADDYSAEDYAQVCDGLILTGAPVEQLEWSDITYWEEIQRLPFLGDDVHEEAWRFYVHRFTRDEFDPIAGRLFEILDTDPRTTVIHRTDYEPDSGYIHHIYECEGY